MRSAVCCLGAVIGLLLSVAPARAEVSWEPAIYPDNQIFPALIISTATLSEPDAIFGSWEGPHLGDEYGLMGAFVDGAPKGAKVRVEVKGNKYVEGGNIEVTIPRKEDSWLILPKVAYNFDALAANRQPRPVNVTMEVFVNGNSLGSQTLTANLRSVNDCLFGVVEDEATDSDYSYLFAAFVNENHPWVDRILRDALGSNIVDSFTGYQTGNDADVVCQVFAIWNEMQRRGLRYSDITTTSFVSDNVYSQHVRTFEDSISARQANCVDGTVLLASVLRKIGIHSYLVIVPGHMFLAFDLDEDGERMLGLETTMMGSEVGEGEPSEWLSDDFRKVFGELDSWAEFEAAITVGSDEIESNWSKFEDDSNYDYQIVDIFSARELGIQPIATVIGED